MRVGITIYLLSCSACINSTLLIMLLCTNAEEGSRESVDAGCMKLTAPWVRDRASQQEKEQAASSDIEVSDIELCSFYEGLDSAGAEGRLEAGVQCVLHFTCQPIKSCDWSFEAQNCRSGFR